MPEPQAEINITCFQIITDLWQAVFQNYYTEVQRQWRNLRFEPRMEERQASLEIQKYCNAFRKIGFCKIGLFIAFFSKCSMHLGTYDSKRATFELPERAYFPRQLKVSG